VGEEPRPDEDTAPEGPARPPAVEGGTAGTEAATTGQAQRIARLRQRAGTHAEHAVSAATRRAYDGDWRHFTAWCAAAGLESLPATGEAVCLYLTDMEAERHPDGAAVFSPATMSRRLAAITHAHRRAGYASPARDDTVRQVLSGITHERRHEPHRMRPLLLDDVRAILAGMNYTSWPDGLTAIRDGFAILAGFAGALRRSELAALTTADVTRHAADGLHVRIRASKTDQAGAGRTIALPHGEHPHTCPVCAYLRWMRVLSAAQHGPAALMHQVITTGPWGEWGHVCEELTPAQPPDGPLLPAVITGGRLAETAVSGDALYVMLTRRAATAGLDATNLGFHSLRAGFVTTARRNGADHRSVRRQTRHGSDAMVETYDREHAPLIGNAVTKLGL
jgi:site-specific recombinase XerD